MISAEVSVVKDKNTVKPVINYPMIIFEGIMWIAAVVFLFPALLTLLNSFKTDAQIILNPISLPDKLAFSNFINAWNATRFPVVLLNTFIITVVSTAGIILISSMAAYILVRTKSRWSWVFFMFFTFSMIVPFQTIMIPLVQTAKDLNLKSVWGIIPIYIGLGCPLAIFMYHGFIKGIPIELEESAAMDGASTFRIFFTIVYPLLLPVTATVSILNVLWLWNDFLLPLIILPKQTTLQLAQYGFFSQFKREYGMAMASLVLSASPVVIFYLIMQKYIIKGITSGAVKG
jgi:raffinose/stachyose/melibiose transport system permease protein